MGTICAWCEAVAGGRGTSDERVSHTLCPGCFEDLRSALASQGLTMERGQEAARSNR